MLAIMTFTLLVSAPIMCVGGIIMALRPEREAVVGPRRGGAGAGGAGHPDHFADACPLFRLMQERIDGISRVLREQIAGIRVIRAFVRERRGAFSVRGGERPALRRRR